MKASLWEFRKAVGPALVLVYIIICGNYDVMPVEFFIVFDDTAVVFAGQSWETVRIAAESALAY